TLGRLEMRIVATPRYTVTDPETGAEVERTFDLPRERQLLEERLNKVGNRDRVREDPTAIKVYNNRERTGDNGSPHLHWYPALYRPMATDPSRWEGGVGSQDVVNVFDQSELLQPPPSKDAKLVQLVPINMEEVYFQGSQLDASEVFAGTDPKTGRPCVFYAFLPDFEMAYADWSEKYTGQASAIILNDIVESVAVFQGRIPGRGIITMGSGTNHQAVELAKVLKTGSLRVRPELQSDVQIGASLGETAIRRGTLSLAIGAAAV